ncbi:hypothetical protein [Listeria floridensis]
MSAKHFRFWKKKGFRDDASAILSALNSPEPLDHFIGVYALSDASVRAELLLFNPLFEMSDWSYLEHLVFTDFDYLPEGVLEQNCKQLVQMWRKFIEVILPLSEKTLSFYQNSLAAVFKLSEAGVALQKEEEARLAAHFLVSFGGKTESEATQLCDAKPLDMPHL